MLEEAACREALCRLSSFSFHVTSKFGGVVPKPHHPGRKRVSGRLGLSRWSEWIIVSRARPRLQVTCVGREHGSGKPQPFCNSLCCPMLQGTTNSKFTITSPRRLRGAAQSESKHSARRVEDGENHASSTGQRALCECGPAPSRCASGIKFVRFGLVAEMLHNMILVPQAQSSRTDTLSFSHAEGRGWSFVAFCFTVQLLAACRPACRV